MSRRPTGAGMVAGSTIAASVVLCGLTGLALAFMPGVPALLGIAGVFIGFAVGFALVYDRFKDL
jgi:hypothetical protein